MIKFNRGERRFHRERLMTNRKEYYGGYAKELTGKELQRLLSLWARTAQVCSCDMCGNPRRKGWEKGYRSGRVSTMQERKAFEFACVQEV